MKIYARNKEEARANMKLLLAKLRDDPTSWQGRSREICRHIESLPSWRNARVVAAFLPLSSEPQIQALWSRPEGPALCFLRIREGQGTLRRIDDRQALRRADWKLADPQFDQAPAVSLGDVDLLLAPGLAFTRGGVRLGRGGGHYDRLLADRSPRTKVVGVCFEIQMVEELPFEAHDHKMDAIVTESGLIRP
jgi:5-formyltetrahydrofolate cyclo-ligase